jgi:hypothetical protein
MLRAASHCVHGCTRPTNGRADHHERTRGEAIGKSRFQPGQRADSRTESDRKAGGKSRGQSSGESGGESGCGRGEPESATAQHAGGRTEAAGGGHRRTGSAGGAAGHRCICDSR